MFQQLETPAAQATDYDIKYELLGAITQVIREAKSRGLSRDRIVDQMNRLLPELERPITLRQLNAWTATSKEFSEFPSRFIVSFCAAAESDLPLRVMARALGLDLIDAREATAKRLGEMQIEIGRLRRQSTDLTRSLGS